MREVQQKNQQLLIIIITVYCMDPNTQNTQLPPTTAENTQQQQQMTPQLAAQLVQLMKDPKVQVRYGTLNAILQYTKSDQSKQLFINTDLFKMIVETMKNAQLHKICLSALIHFSSNQNCAQKLVDFVNPIVMDLRTAEGLPEQLGLLLLLNISKQYQFTAKLLNRSEKQGQKQQQVSSFLLEVIYSFIESKPSRRWVMANIFVNISSHDIGREYIAKQKLYLGFLKHINDEKQSLRLAVLRILRNVAFMWENQDIVTEILKKQNHFIDQIAIHILIMIIKSKLIPDPQNAIKLLKQSGFNNILDYDMEIQPDLPKIVTTKEKSINQIQICVDILIIISNCDFPKRKPEFLKDQLKKVISIVNFTGISQESKDKLQALETFCFW